MWFKKNCHVLICLLLDDTKLFTYLQVSSSDNSSTDLGEFLGMEGLQCGNEGGQVYRNGSIDSIRKGCFPNSKVSTLK